jgi:diphthine synthase
MLYIIGLGLSDASDITLKGLKAVQSADKVYLEHYTSVLGGGADYIAELEALYGKNIALADRTLVEQGADEIIDAATTATVAFLVVGDPFGATTHTDLVLRAVHRSVPYQVIHNASIMNAVGCCGLQLYNYGECVSVCFWSEKEGWRPKSHFPKVAENRARGLHTLCLLDIKVKEKSVENLIRGRDVYEPARFMTVAQACAQFMEIIDEVNNNIDSLKNGHHENEDDVVDSVEKQIGEIVRKGVVSGDTLCVGMARVGRHDQRICVDTIRRMADVDLGAPLHSLVVAGKLHPLEVDFLRLFANKAGPSDGGEAVDFDSLVSLHNKYFTNS